MFSSLFSSIDNNLYAVLDDITFINIDIMNNTYLNKFLGDSTSGIIAICNSFIIGFILYYAFFYLLSYLTFSQIEKPHQFIFKLLTSAILMNSSLFIVRQFIFLNSTISLAIRNIGESLFEKEICFSTLINTFNSNFYLEDSLFNIFSIDGIIKSFISFNLINLVFSYSLRYIMLQVLILISPFAFISLILNSSSWIFKSWLKIFFSMLFLQILISFILLITFSLDFSSNISFKLMYVGSIFALVKANGFLKDFIGGFSTDINIGINNIKSKFLRRSVIILKFIFPQNYCFKNKLFGFLDYTTVILNIIWYFFIFCFLDLILSSLYIKISLFIIFCFPVFLFSITGFHHEDILYVLVYIIKFIIRRKVYIYYK